MPFQTSHLYEDFVTFCLTTLNVLQPPIHLAMFNTVVFTTARLFGFGLDSVSLAATQEITIVFFSFGYWDVSLPQVCSDHTIGNRHWIRLGFPIQKSPGHRLLPPHRSLSQAVASFIAIKNQGIHYTPLDFLLGNLYITHNHMSRDCGQKNMFIKMLFTVTQLHEYVCLL